MASAAPAVLELRHPTILQPRAGLLFALWLTLTILGGFQRFGLSPDNIPYYQFYLQLGPNLDLAASRFEPGFQLWAWIANQWLGLSFDLFIASIIGTALGIKFILMWRYLSMPVVAAIAYVAGFYFLHEYTQIRAALGVAFAFWAVHQQLEGRWKSAIALYALGMLFHYSVAIIPLITIGSFFVRRWPLLSLAGLVGVGVVLALPFSGPQLLSFLSQLNPLTETYYYGDTEIQGVNILSAVNIAMMLAIVYALVIKLYSRSSYHSMFLILGISSIVVLVIFSGSLMLALRLKEVLWLAFIFAFLRSRPQVLDLPLIALVLAANLYLLTLGVGSLTIL